MKGPSIAVMLGHEPEHDEAEGEPEASDLKERAKDGAKALGEAVLSKDPERIYRAFEALKTICDELKEREGDGEEEKEPESEKSEDGEESKSEDY